MEDLRKLNINWPKAIKIFGIVLLALVVLSIAVNLVVKPIMSQVRMGSSFGNSSSVMKYQSASPMNAPMASYDYAKEEGVSLSFRNTAGSVGYSDSMSTPQTSNGAYEVMNYNATIETGKLEKDCSSISELKGLDYVVFNNSNIGKKNCNFSFKVEREKVDEVLGMIKGLKPRDMSQNVETIKKQIEDFTSREEILKSKQASIDDTLKNAIASYDEISKLATKTSDAESLTKVIDSKISILERLTSERLQVSNELESLGRAKAEQLDRLKYVDFYVYIYENKVIDGQEFKDYWVASFKSFVLDINQLLKDLSLGLVAFVMVVVKYLVYIFLLFVVGKFCWEAGKKIWKK